MDVPQFPLPPARNASILSVRDARTRAVSFSFAPREHHARKQLGSNGRHKLHRRNTVNPRLVRQRGKCIRKRVTELCLKMTDHNDLPPTISPDVIQPALPSKNENIVVTPSTISENISTPDTEINQPRQMTLEIVSTGAQTIHSMPYRLRFLPVLRDIVDNDKGTKKSSTFCKYLRFLGRLSLSQFGLLWLLVLWTMVGASAFYGTEGPRERYQTLQLKDRQKELSVSLAMELRQLQTKEEDVEPQWSKKVQVYMSKHEKILLKAVNAGYGEGGESGQLWTFPGCILFAISLLTTLGFGAPVPRTNAGRMVTVFFAGIGIPLHFILVMNLGLLLATYIKIHAINHKFKRQDIVIGDSMPSVSRWIKVIPFLFIFFYYVIGVLAFGIARLRPFSASVLFPLDFTAAGGLATTSGHVRIFYGLYLEAAVILTSVAVAVFRVSTTQSLTNIGLKYDLLTCAKH